MPSGADGLDEILGSVHFLLDIEQRLLGLTAQVLLVLLILVHGVDKRLREGKFRHLAIIKREGDGAVVLRVHNEIGCDLLQASSDGLTHRGTWTWVQLAQFSEEGLTLLVVQREGRLYAPPVLVGELVEIFFHNLLHQLFHARVITSCYLQEQTFL